MPDVDILYFEAGSGHRAAALALAAALREVSRDLHPVPVDILEVIAGHPRFRSTVATGIDYFNWWLRRELVWDLAGTINLSLLAHDLVRAKGIALIAEFWRQRREPPALVVSVTPMYNLALSRALALAAPGVPYLVVPVDFAEGKRRYWFTPAADLHYALGKPELLQTAQKLGILASRIHRIGGMPIDPAFYRAPEVGREALLAALELDPAQPTGLVHFGGQGSVLTRRVAEALDDAEPAVNVIFLCGRDEHSRRAVEALPTRYPRRVFGFTDDPPSRYYHAADFVVGKPGAMTITEALVTRTPMLAIRSRGMRLVQGGNERWLEQSGVGRVVRMRDLPAAVRDAVNPELHRAAIEREWHRGVYDLAEVVAALAA